MRRHRNIIGLGLLASSAAAVAAEVQRLEALAQTNTAPPVEPAPPVVESRQVRRARERAARKGRHL